MWCTRCRRSRPTGSFADRRFEEWRAGIRRGDPRATDALGRLLDAIAAKPVLTDRERCVLQMTADGLTAREIAAQWRVSADTVRQHRKRILLRLGAANSTHAVALGIKRGLIT